MSEGGMPQAGYNPHAVGAAPGGQPDPQSRLGGILPDANVSQGLALNSAGAGHLLNAKMTTGLASDKPSGIHSSQNVQRLWKTKPTFEGFERIQAPEISGPAIEAGMALNGAGVEPMGPVSTASLGDMSPPSVGVDMNRGMGMGR
jgi:hypothetical protein